MTSLERLYTAGMHVTRVALPLFGRGDGKIARGIRGRRGVLERMAVWAEAERDGDRPLVWFHAASVGEGLQARAVIEAFRSRRPDAQVAYTFFSPSAEALASRIPADFADYLPLDLPDAAGRALDLMRPAALVFSKYDVWPNLSAEATRRGVGLALLSATLPAGSSRLRGAARALLRPAYSRLDAVAAISPEDAERFSALGVAPDRRSVMGDARFDQVAAVSAATDPASAMLRPLHDPTRFTLVAGSTWPADEERLLPAWSRIRPRPRLLILAPHEPTSSHLASTERTAASNGLSVERMSLLDGRGLEADVLLVDRVGALGELYAVANAAYVGGGWGSAGLHSVLEPAAYGIPVIFGPRHANAREAGELIARGGAFAVEGLEALTGCLELLASSPAEREAAGEAARCYVQQGTGAAERGASIVERLLAGGPRTDPD